MTGGHQVTVYDHPETQRQSMRAWQAWCTGAVAAAAAAASIKRAEVARSEAAAAGAAEGGRLHKIARAVAHLRAGEDEMRLRWQRDELGWRKLPARAWPPYQPTADDIPVLAARLADGKCSTNVDGLLPVVFAGRTSQNSDAPTAAAQDVDCVQGVCICVRGRARS